MSATRDNSAAFLGVAACFAIIMMGTTLPTPLYPLYQQAFGFSHLIITVIYAVYALGVMAALLLVGNWSDQLGRRPMLIAGLLFAAASALAFILADGLAPLLAGRLLSGVSAGIFTGTATVAVIELAPPHWRARATLVATGVNMGGLGLGPLLAGALAEAAPLPLRLPFWVAAALLACGLLAVLRAPETVRRTTPVHLRVRRLAIPAKVRSTFVPAAAAAFAAFAVLGMLTALAPSFLGELLGRRNPALAGLLVFLMFMASTAGQCLQGYLEPQRSLRLACLVLAGACLLLVVAIQARGLTLMLTASMVAGLGHGLAFRAGLEAVTRAAPPARRAEVASAYFVVAYVGISIPIVGIGLLARAIGLAGGGMLFTALVALLALGVAVWLQLAGVAGPVSESDEAQ